MVHQKPAPETRHGADQLYLFGHRPVLADLDIE
jgi:hypothetical protein